MDEMISKRIKTACVFAVLGILAVFFGHGGLRFDGSDMEKFYRLVIFGGWALIVSSISAVFCHDLTR